MKKLFVAVMAMAITLGVLAPVVLQGGTASACTPGLSPGYWKNHTEVWNGSDPEWVGPLPGDSFYVVFQLEGLNDMYGDPVADPGITLEQALNSKGGGQDALNRMAVASLLNAYGVPGALGEGYVIEWVQNAYVYYRWEVFKDNLEKYIE